MANIQPKLSSSKSKITPARSAPLVKRPYGTAEYKVTLYQNILTVHKVNLAASTRRPPMRTAGDITRLSRKSRLRAMQTISKIRTDFLFRPIFLTFTYHNNYPSVSRELKNDLDKFIKSVRRHFREVSFFYRIELQKRGAPHFHFIFFFPNNSHPPPDHIFTRIMGSLWIKQNRCGCKDCKAYSVQASRVTNLKQASYYVAKYMTKKELNASGATLGRLWNRSANLPLNHYMQFEIDYEDFQQLKRRVTDWLIKGSEKSFQFAQKIQALQSFFLFCDINSSANIMIDILAIDSPSQDLPPP